MNALTFRDGVTATRISASEINRVRGKVLELDGCVVEAGKHLRILASDVDIFAAVLWDVFMEIDEKAGSVANGVIVEISELPVPTEAAWAGVDSFNVIFTLCRLC